jgi:hypothetical protein|tara:strand:- start:280 stop:1236 length:957 start_codon:yes stop_codon:yes gene_type:complete
MDNATPKDALEEVEETSEDAPKEENQFTSDRQKALEDIYERRSKEIDEEGGFDEEVESPIWHDGEEWKTRIKVDGQELEVPFDSLKGSHQKDQASQKRFEVAAAKERQLIAREQQINQYVANLNSRPPQQDAAEEGEVSDVDDIVEKYHSALFEDDAQEAARLLKTLSNSGRGNATQNVEEVVRRAITSYDQSKKAEVEKVHRLQYQRSLEEAVRSFEEDFPDIAESPELRTVADNKTVTLTQENPDWTPAEIIKAAAEYTRDWAGTMPKSNGRFERKKKIVRQPRSALASANIGSDEAPMTPSEIVQEMKKARGQLL